MGGDDTEPKWVRGLYEKLDEHQNDFRETIRLEMAPVVLRVESAEKDLGCIKTSVKDHDDFIKAQRNVGFAMMKGGAIIAGLVAFGKLVHDWFRKG